MAKAQRTPREEIERVLKFLGRSLGYWKRAFLVFLVTMLIAVPFVFTRPRSYKSETVILYQETIRSSDLTGVESGTQDPRRVAARLREMLLSRQSLEPIVTELQLYGNLAEQRSAVDAVDEIRRHISFRAREGDTFEITFTGDNPKTVQDVTKRLGNCIIQEAVNRRAEQAKATKEFLDKESERNQTELRLKEQALANYLSLHPEFAAPPGMPLGTMPTARLPGVPGAHPPRPGEDPSIVALEARAARIERQLRNDGTPRTAPPPPTAPIAPTPTVTMLPDSAELVAARRDFADKSQRFTEKHPDVIAAKNRLAAAEAAQAAAQAAAPPPTAANTATPPPVPTHDDPAPTPEQREALKKQLTQIVGEIAQRRAALKAAGGTAPAPASSDTPVSLEVEYRRLLREVTETRERQHQLDEKLFKAGISVSSALNDRNIQVSVLDPAFLPTHSISQPRSSMLMIGLIIALILASVTALISALLDDRIHDRVDLEILDILPVVAVIPRLPPGPNDRKR